MIPRTKDMYVRTVGGCYVAWSLDVPSEWGEWTMVDVVTPGAKNRQGVKLQIVPRRALLPEEVWLLRSRPLTFWGMKVSCSPWALVMCREVGVPVSSLLYKNMHYDQSLAIGV